MLRLFPYQVLCVAAGAVFGTLAPDWPVGAPAAHALAASLNSLIRHISAVVGILPMSPPSLVPDQRPYGPAHDRHAQQHALFGRLAETGRCGQPTTDGSRWCAAHVDLWARGAAHAVGLWRFPEILYGDVVDFRPPMPVSADEMRQWAKSTADLLRLGFGAMDEKEARRWSTPPSL